MFEIGISLDLDRAVQSGADRAVIPNTCQRIILNIDKGQRATDRGILGTHSVTDIRLVLHHLEPILEIGPQIEIRRPEGQVEARQFW